MTLQASAWCILKTELERFVRYIYIYRQHSFSLSCETAPNTVLQDTRTNNNGKQIMNLVTFERNKTLLGLWYTYVTACKQYFND